MTLSPELIPSDWLWLFHLVALASLLLGLRHFPLRAIVSVPERQHLFGGTALAMAILWTVGASLQGEGIRLHLLGVTVAVMLLGSGLTLVAGALSMLLYSLVTLSAWSMLPVNYTVLIALPTLISHGWLKLIARIPLNNLFLYMLGGGFVGGIITRLGLALAFYTLGAAADPASPLAIAADKYLPWLLLLAFPEGFINGMVASALTVFFPHWMRSLDERRYIDEN